MEEVDVVVGVILKGNKFLVERRRLDEKADPGIVCLPGGHVRKGESREEALKGMLEELDIKVKGLKFIFKNFYIASNGERQNAYCYLVTDYEGIPICKSAREIFWEDNINNLNLEVDKKTMKKLGETNIIATSVKKTQRFACITLTKVYLTSISIFRQT